MQFSRSFHLRLFGAFWAFGVALFTVKYFTNPGNPALTGIARYGTTYMGELADILGLTAVEVLVSAAILRPWSYRQSWGRALTAAAVLAPWLLVRVAVGMHAGPTTRAHTRWLLLFLIGLVIAAIVSGTAAVRARGRSSPLQQSPGS
jgi:hypothetical protein